MRQWTNQFAITNQDELAVEYRLLRVQGLPPGESYDKNLQRLVKQVAYEMRQPVAPVRQGDDHCLAIPAHVPLPPLQQRLTPHVATLQPASTIQPLAFNHLDAATLPIAVAFLHFAFGGLLWRDRRLWEYGRKAFSKRPLNGHDQRATIDVYPGFGWNVVPHDDGRLFLAVDTTVRYIDRHWLTTTVANGAGDPQAYRWRHCVYHYGHQWYVIQIRSIAGLSIAEQYFAPGSSEDVVSVFDYTKAAWAAHPVPWIHDLDPTSPAIVYRNPGKDQDRYGALALCKLTRSTAEAEAAGLHRRAILDPAERVARVSDVVARYFQGARLAGQPVHVTPELLEVEPRAFAVPALRFGHDRVLAVATGDQATASLPALPVTDRTPLQQLGQRRLQLVRDRQAGPLDMSPFDAQYLLVPQSVPRAIVEDFEQRFVRAMRELSGQPHYAPRRILYDDRGATSLLKQVRAIRSAIAEQGLSRGYGLLMLPPRADHDLHNFIKTELWPNLQLQCLLASKLQGFYERKPTEPDAYQVSRDREGKFASYLRNCALGMLAVNRKWLWALATPLHYDMYVGIDVLNRMAGLTFVYNGGEQIYFQNYHSRQPERLTMPQLRDMLVTNLREHLSALAVRPRSLIVHRDGRTFPSELAGIRRAVQDLQQAGLLPLDLTLGVVDIRKSSANLLRLVEGDHPEAIANPTLGSYYLLGAREGIVCTTGRPFHFPGTAQPLAAVIAEGPLNLTWVLEDIFALAQLGFTAPDRCVRLPITIKLADDLLTPIAGAVEESAEDDDDGDMADAAVPASLDALRPAPVSSRAV
jgi:hypothetical protein